MLPSFCQASTPLQRKLKAMKTELRQLSIKETFERRQIWDINEHKTKMANQKVFNMLVSDNLPWSHVENQGFIELMAHMQPRYQIPSRTFFSNMLPTEHAKVESVIFEELSAAPFISFTSDIWSDTHSRTTHMSLTGKLLGI